MTENQTHRPEDDPPGPYQGPHGTVVLSADELPDGARPGAEGDITPDAPALIGLSAYRDRRFRLQSDATQVGRNPDGDIVLEDADVSFDHARIVRSGGEWRVVNLQSTNGTFINGRETQQAALSHGDRVAFGPAAFVFATADISPEALEVLAPASRGGRRWWIASIGLAIAAVAAVLVLVLVVLG